MLSAHGFSGLTDYKNIMTSELHKKGACLLPMEEREASRIACALALSIVISSRDSKLSSLNSFRSPINLASLQYVALSLIMLMSSGKW